MTESIALWDAIARFGSRRIEVFMKLASQQKSNRRCIVVFGEQPNFSIATGAIICLAHALESTESNQEGTLLVRDASELPAAARWEFVGNIQVGGSGTFVSPNQAAETIFRLIMSSTHNWDIAPRQPVLLDLISPSVGEVGAATVLAQLLQQKCIDTEALIARAAYTGPVKHLSDEFRDVDLVIGALSQYCGRISTYDVARSSLADFRRKHNESIQQFYK